MDIHTLVDLLPTIEKIAGDAHRTYGMDKGDALGILSVEVARNVDDYLILFAEQQIGLLERRLMNVAARKARQERIKRMSESANYFYEPEYVRLFLPFFFDREDWDCGPVNDDASQEWRTGEAIDTALDIKGAWPRIKSWQAQVIQARHLQAPPNQDGGIDWDAIGELCGYASAEAARVSYYNATRELTFEMNDARIKRMHAYEGPGARTAMSNARANAILSDN